MTIAREFQQLWEKSKYGIQIAAATVALCAGGFAASAAPIGQVSPISFADPLIFFGQMPSGFAFGNYIDASIAQADADTVSLEFSFLDDLGGEFSFLSFYFPETTHLTSLSGGIIFQDFRTPAATGPNGQSLTGLSFAKTANSGFVAGDELSFTLAATGASAADWDSFATQNPTSGHYGLSVWSNPAGINTAVSGLSGTATTPAPVPLPASGLLLFAAVCGLVASRKAKNRNRQSEA